MCVIDRIYFLFIFCWIIYVPSLIFLRASFSSDKMNLSIPDLTARAQNNSFCALGMTILDYEFVLMAE